MHDEARCGRPSLVNDDLVCKVNERVRDDRHFTFLICTYNETKEGFTLLIESRVVTVL